MLTASRLALARHCLAWTHLAAPDRSSSYADTGTALHRCIERFAVGEIVDPAEEAKAVGADPDEVEALFGAWLGSPLSAVAWEVEVPFALLENGTCRRLPGRGRAAYSGVEGVFFGTADLLDRQEDALVVGDVKTGRQAHLEPAADHAQLHALALLATTALGLHRAVVATYHVTEDGVEVDEYEMTREDFARAAREIQRALAEAPGSVPRPGSHCRDRFCPAMAVCPEATAAAEALVPLSAQTPARYSFTEAISSPEHGAWMVSAIPLVEAALEEAKRRTREYADAHGGIPTAPGKRWCGKPVARESIIVDAEAEAILDRMGAGAAVEVKRTATKAAITKAAGKQAETVLDALRVAGKVREAAIQDYRERKA